MRLLSRRIARWLLALLAAGVLAGAAAPYWNLDRYGRRIQAILESELRRRVSVGKVRLDLFGGPGVSLSDVVIYDDPRIGREPLAYVSSLEARVALRSLWTGRLEFASLRWVEPSVNLARPAGGPWNFEELIQRALPSGAGTARRLPAIQVRSGRINFKAGDVKSVFYFTNADVDLAPADAGPATWSIRFSGEPARTDRPARGLGRITGKGWWRPGERLELTLELEKSYLEEITALLAGRDLGLRGHLISRAQLSGPTHRLELTGKAQVRDFRRWDVLPPLGGDWDFSYRGRLNLPEQVLTLEATPDGKLPARLHLRVSDFLSEPRWGLLAILQDLPLNLAPGWLRVAGLDSAMSYNLEGLVSGALAYSLRYGLQGTLVAAGEVRVSGRSAFRFPRARVVVDREQIQLTPSQLEWSTNEAATLEGTYSRRRSVLRLRLRSRHGPTGSLLGLPELPAPPLLADCRGGFWNGELVYEQSEGGAGGWFGAARLADTEIRAPGFAEPLRVTQAELRLDPRGVTLEKLHGAVGGIVFQGRYEHRPSERRQHRFEVEIPELDPAELERVLAPVLDRRKGLLRALGLARPPAWLANRRVEGRFHIAALRWSDVRESASVRGHVLWDGLRVAIHDLAAHVGAATLQGRAEIELDRPAPVYRLTAAVGPLEWSGGHWEAEGVLETSGLGEELLSNSRLSGAFLGRAVELAPGAAFESVAGRFQFRFVRGAPRLVVEGLEAAQQGELYRGTCRNLPDGRLLIEFSDGPRPLRLAGRLWPPTLEKIETR